MSNFFTVTERGGEWVSPAQLDRFLQRYLWAGHFGKGKDVLEVACGTGPGLGYLNSVAKTLIAGDISDEVLAPAQEYYGDRIRIEKFDAAETPCGDESVDVVVIFEAIYYLPELVSFLAEVKRVLRPGGVLLIATANKDLADFNPSPFSVSYYNPPELSQILSTSGFDSEFFAGSPIASQSLVGWIYHALKKFAVKYRLVPSTMRGKKLLKLIFSGRLVKMPIELEPEDEDFEPLIPIGDASADTVHQVIYCLSRKR